jgi:hypothetical protein
MKRATAGIRVFYCVAWLCGIGCTAAFAYDVVMPVARTVTTTLHNALLDNRGLHD